VLEKTEYPGARRSVDSAMQISRKEADFVMDELAFFYWINKKTPGLRG
jgi:hypothetical protein